VQRVPGQGSLYISVKGLHKGCWRASPGEKPRAVGQTHGKGGSCTRKLDVELDRKKNLAFPPWEILIIVD